MRKMIFFILFTTLLSFSLKADINVKNIWNKGIFQLYEDNRKEGIGNYITADFLLSIHSLLIQRIMIETEKQEAIPSLKLLLNELFDKHKEIYTTNKEEPIKWNLCYLGVVKSLLDGDIPKDLPVEILNEIEKEMTLIKLHKGIETSPINKVLEDYTQYIPRGYYTQTPELENYFLARLYLSRNGFFIKESKATGVDEELANRHIKQARFLYEVIEKSEELKNTYNKLLEKNRFLVGEPDDLNLFWVSGEFNGAKTVRENLYRKAKDEGCLPKIISIIIQPELLEEGLLPSDVALTIKILPSYRTIDSHLFQNLVYDKVKDYLDENNPFTLITAGNKKVRGFPRLFDFLSAIGFQDAIEFIKEEKDDKYIGYYENLKMIRNELKKELQKPQSIYSRNLRLISILNAYGAEVESGAGFYIENRHKYLLYAKQSYTAVPRSLEMIKERKTAYLDPYPLLYIEMAYIIEDVKEKIGILKDDLSEYVNLLKRLSEIGYKISNKDFLESEEDIKFLNDLDLRLKKCVGGVEGYPVVVDLHTEPSTKTVLEAATGFEIKMKDELRGLNYVIYEFKVPANERLTDKEWKEKLEKGQVNPIF